MTSSPKPYKSSKPAAAAAAAAAPLSTSTWLQVAQDFLTADGWPFELAEDEGGSESLALLTRFQGESGIHDITLEVDEGLGLVVVHVRLPVQLIAEDGQDEEQIAEIISGVAELVVRLNAGLAVGGLDLEIDEGTVTFRVGMLLDGVPPVQAAVRNAVYTAVQSADRYAPLVAAVASGEIDAAGALEALAEGE